MNRTVQELEEVARRARVDTIKELHIAQSGHPGSSLSAMDFMVAAYFGGYLNHDPKNLQATDRDLFVLSVGHAVPGLYACLAHAGYGSFDDLRTLRKLGGLPGHAKRGGFPGVEASAGSLGQGLNIGVGAALGFRLQGRQNKVFVLMSDGEQQEGSVWEAVMAASKYELSSLVAFVDKNGNQINGTTHDIMPSMDNLSNKYEAFGWRVREVNGNSMQEVVTALDWAVGGDGPSVIIGNTRTGYPLKFMMDNYHWHHGIITDTLFTEAMSELDETVSRNSDPSWLPGH